MNNTSVSSAILIFSGTILVSVAMVAEAIKQSSGSPGSEIGVLLILAGVLVMALPTLKSWWQAVPVERKSEES